MDPDDYDRLMGISSANPSEEGGFGDGELTDTEGVEEVVANDLTTSLPQIILLENVLVLMEVQGGVEVLVLPKH